MCWAEIGEITKAIAPVFTAGAACAGAYIGYRGLEKWRAETIGKRRHELAEQALISFYEVRDIFTWVRSRGIFGGEGQTRTATGSETAEQKDRRNTYFIPIERLNREKAVFARLQTLRYAFAAHFGDDAVKPFANVMEAHQTISASASTLIQLTSDSQDRASEQSLIPLRDALGWGPGQRPDDIDKKIAEAVSAIEALCKPVLLDRPQA